MMFIFMKIVILTLLVHTLSFNPFDYLFKHLYIPFPTSSDDWSRAILIFPFLAVILISDRWRKKKELYKQTSESNGVEFNTIELNNKMYVVVGLSCFINLLIMMFWWITATLDVPAHHLVFIVGFSFSCILVGCLMVVLKKN